MQGKLQKCHTQQNRGTSIDAQWNKGCLMVQGTYWNESVYLGVTYQDMTAN